jgi:Xaa-Pro aminopeptidase
MLQYSPHVIHSGIAHFISNKSIADARKLAEKIKKKGGKELVGSTINLVDKVWGQEKPARPNEKVKVHPVKYSGKEVSAKIQDVVKELEKKKAAGLVVCKFMTN